MLSFKNYISESEMLDINESRASDKFELAIADSLADMGYDASRPKVDSTYSDVLVKYKGKKVWIEVKMNHTDNLGNTRASWDGKNWVSAPEKRGPLAGKMGPLKVYIAKMLKAHAKDFVSKITAATGKSKINTNKGPQQKDKDTISHEEMKAFMATQKDQYIVTVPGQNLGAVVRDHYAKGGKTEAAYYLQAGDDFYRLSNEDPLGVAKDVPMFSGKGDFRMRVGIRTGMYEIQPEVKVKSMENSPYSIKPGTRKKNPFTYQRVREANE
jgi:hypothetical protein